MKTVLIAIGIAAVAVILGLAGFAFWLNSIIPIQFKA